MEDANDTQQLTTLERQPRNDRFKIKDVIAALQQTRGIKLAAARLIGCDRSTIDRYVRRYPTVAAAKDEASEGLLDIAEANIARAIQSGDLGMSQWFLIQKGKGRSYGKQENTFEVSEYHQEKIEITVVYEEGPPEQRQSNGANPHPG
jgi:hypothetical protein